MNHVCTWEIIFKVYFNKGSFKGIRKFQFKRYFWKLEQRTVKNNGGLGKQGEFERQCSKKGVLDVIVLRSV